jgi:uncharacterized protein
VNQTVQVTEAALEVIHRLEAAHGPLNVFQSGGCCEGSCPVCLREDELMPGSGDELIGEVDGVRFYIDRDQYERWGRPGFVLDVAPGAATGFSLEGLEGVHFVTRAPGLR